ncbi:hypothetical protein [Erwinia mallotivora]|uniref:Cytoplasmic protein n=1 Tax=Erwinia mallotivora TaxID=69222 RepID=A0A014NRB4_9GAMM|nr:hypothetical protein [Erwinia mallotivora]EXU76380.1 cytoplasmic protein [Erwinia mallotivora]
MQIVSRVPFDLVAKKHPNAASALDLLYRQLRQGQSNTPDELKALYASLDHINCRILYGYPFTAL